MVDNFGNEETNNQALSALIDTVAPQPIKNFSYELLEANSIKLNWSPSLEEDVTSYNIYTDNGSGIVDYSTPIATIDRQTLSWTSSPLAEGQHRFGIVAEDNSGNK